MGCGSSTPGMLSVSPSLGVVGIGSHPNASLVVGGVGDGRASTRNRRLTERPPKPSQTFGDDARTREERERERQMAAEQRRKEKEIAAAMLSAATAAVADELAGEDLSGLLPLSPMAAAARAAAAADTDDDDAADEYDSTSESASVDDDSMEEIEEETMERPVDDSGMFSPAPPTVRPRPLLQHGSSLQKLVQAFAPENTHVLIVDDDVTHMEIVAQWLAQKRYHVTLCNDGEEAVEVLSAGFHTPTAPETVSDDDEDGIDGVGVGVQPVAVSSPSAGHEQAFDLILCDMAMEAPDGAPLLDWVLRHEQIRRIPFVLMSPDASSQSCDRGLRRGAEDFFQKPLQRQVLLKTIRTILESRIELRNTAALKSWGDKYKHQLMTEKRKKDAIAAAAAAAHAVVATLPQLSPYVSPSGSLATTPSSAQASRFSPIKQPTPNGVPVVPLEGDTPDAEPTTVTPHPQLIPPPSSSTRKQLQIHVPLDSASPPPPPPSAIGIGVGGVGAAASLQSPPGTFAMTPFDSSLCDEERAVVGEATVLLVDPVGSTRGQLAQWLASINYTLLVHASMEDAIDFLRRAAPQVQRAATFMLDEPNTLAGVGSQRGGLGLGVGGQRPSFTAANLDRIGSITTPLPESPGATPPQRHLPRRSITNFTLPPGVTVAAAAAAARNSPMATPETHPRTLLARAGASRGLPCDLIIADAEPFATPAVGGPQLADGDGGMTGSQFIAAVQANALTKNIPVMLLYQSSTGRDVTESIRHGVEAVLVKPLSKDMLLKKVNQVLTTIAQKKRSDMYAERAQAYRTILTAFRAHRDEEVRLGRRGSPLTPKQKRNGAGAGQQSLGAGLSAKTTPGPSSRATSSSNSPIIATRVTATDAGVTPAVPATVDGANTPLGESAPLSRKGSNTAFTFNAAPPQTTNTLNASATATPPITSSLTVAPTRSGHARTPSTTLLFAAAVSTHPPPPLTTPTSLPSSASGSGASTPSSSPASRVVTRIHLRNGSTGVAPSSRASLTEPIVLPSASTASLTNDASSSDLLTRKGSARIKLIVRDANSTTAGNGSASPKTTPATAQA